MSAKVVTLILSDEQTRGKGVVQDPVRRVYSLYTTDGRHVALLGPMAVYSTGSEDAWTASDVVLHELLLP